MKTNIKFSVMLLAILLLTACGAKQQDRGKSESTETETVSSTSSTDEDQSQAPGSSEESYAKSDNEKGSGIRNEDGEIVQQPQPIPTSSSAAQTGGNDSTRKIIRTADLKFRVKEVVPATYAIEDIVKYFGGFVSSTHMQSEVERTDLRKVTADSSLETTWYTISNTMVLRVPVEKLDSTLKAIALLIDFVDYRTITAEDVTLSILRTELEQKRLKLYQMKVEGYSNTSNANLDSRINAEERILSRQIEQDEAMLTKMELLDRMAYSQISLNFYQREVARYDMIPNEKSISSYRPGYGSRLVESLEAGWYFLGNLLLVLITIWPLYLVGGIVWFTIRYFRRKK